MIKHYWKRQTIPNFQGPIWKVAMNREQFLIDLEQQQILRFFVHIQIELDN